jgi:hypothetical protein
VVPEKCGFSRAKVRSNMFAFFGGKDDAREIGVKNVVVIEDAGILS